VNTMVTFEAKKINVNNFRLSTMVAAYSMVLNVLAYGERPILLSLAIALFIGFGFLCLSFFVIKRRAGGRFSFNDEEQKIITKRKYVIPYNKVKTINIFKTIHFLRVDAFLSDFIGRRIPLLFTDIQDEERVTLEIKKRFKDEKIKIKRFSAKQIFIILTIPVLLQLLITLDLYQKFPQLKIFPKQYVQKNEANELRETNAHISNGFNFILSKDFLQKKEKCTGGKMIFSSENPKTFIVVRSAIGVNEPKKEKKFILALFGAKDDYDVFRNIYYNRLGIRMLINKAALLAQEEEKGIVERYEINKNSLKGFLVLKKQNKEQGKSMAAFFLVDKKTHNGIYFTVISQDKIDAKLFDMLINGVSIRKE